MLNCAEDNEARIVGYVASDLSFSHCVHTEGFYRFVILSDRLSDNKDAIIVGAGSLGKALLNYKNLGKEINMVMAFDNDKTKCDNKKIFHIER